MFTNAEPIEVAWTLFGLVALVVNGLILAEAIHELRVSYMRPPNRKRRLIATSAFFLHGGLTTKQVIVVGIGVVAMDTPSAQGGRGYPLLGLLFIVGLFTNEVIAATIGLIARFFRWRLDRALDEEERVVSEQEHDAAMQDREDARAARHEDRQDARAALAATEDRADLRAARRDDRQDARDLAVADAQDRIDNRRNERERNRT